MSQPLRTSVDPQTLSAACTLRAAAVMVEAKHRREARALYERVLVRYAHGDLVYYVEQAKEALAALQDAAPAVVVLRAHEALSR